MATTPNYGWVTPAPTDYLVDLPADFETFADAVDADLAGLLGGTTNQVLKKTSNADHAFAFGVDPTFDLVTTAGDLVYGTGADAMTRLGIGTAGQVLTVNSGATAPQWSTPAAGGGMTSISSGNVSNSLVISSISGSYKDLVLVVRNYRGNNDPSSMSIAPNGFSANTAASITTYGNVTAQSFNSSSWEILSSVSGQTPNVSFAILWIHDYTSSGWKTAEVSSVAVNSANTAQYNARRAHFVTNKTAAITSLEFSIGGGVANGTYILYGVN